ncbi:SDR family NAD(P)-dependent oxidoreductase [Streptomyces sp. YU58]|uniref:SDR family NAD(P)-dependent oxidoreductase n=1 Tax=Streptomyces sp. SX92 TaxID=3158972 RepID=UPI0027B931D0|nr:SDR family NAD(P)-dependent oxidoreductase [Streptomyces coralus]WLW50721.1 SDR family NAD(P)-dependent oxidoreductase [Streptomyces coralus]
METRTALVTGAAQGLGQQFAIALAARGYRVAGLDLVPQPETAAKILDYVELVGDAGDETQIEEGLERVIDRFGTLHVVVNNGGVHPAKPFEETTVEDWRRVMRANLEGPFVVTRAALPYLKAARRGRIVNIASAAVFTAPPTMVAYVASKTGLIGFTRALAAALGPYDITVNAIAPGPGCGAADERAQEPSDLVSTLLYVVDEGSGFLTGQTLNVSGGSVCL